MILANKHIFVLEDELPGQAVITMAITSQGGEIVLDHWGDRTLTRLKEYHPTIDLFILDLMLPGRKTGYDILAEIRKDARFDEIPAVIVSGSDPDVEIPRAQANGVKGFICKPIDRYRFPHQLLEIINGGEVWDQ